jgi:hypothetical protein
MAKRPDKTTPKPKKTKGENFEDVARKLFKVPKSEIDPKAKKA